MNWEFHLLKKFLTAYNSYSKLTSNCFRRIKLSINLLKKWSRSYKASLKIKNRKPFILVRKHKSKKNLPLLKNV